MRKRLTGAETRAMVLAAEKRAALASLILGGLSGLIGGALGGALARWVWGG